MSTIPSKILIVEDTPSLARTYEAYLDEFGHQCQIVGTGAEAQELIQTTQFDCILLDLKLPDCDGMDLLTEWSAKNLEVPIVVVTASGSMKVAVDAMRAGASDFLVKPITQQRLEVTIENNVKNLRLARTVKAYEKSEQREGFCQFVGKSVAMQSVYKTIEACAPSRASVFIHGETGTGKELAAQAIHEKSKQSGGNFVAINCGALPKDLIESEIFGHKKGAFTGATADRVGAAGLADGGTLFLDEITEMPIELQPKLLRFIQTGQYSRIGETTTRHSNIRFVAATNRDPLSAVESGHLREDLYYRLHVIPVYLPPLRERDDDILLLANHFLNRFSEEEGKSFQSFDVETEQAILSYHWPGNVRELQNTIRRACVVAQGDAVKLSHLGAFKRAAAPGISDMPSVPVAEPVRVLQSQSMPQATHLSQIQPLWKAEKQFIESAIELCEGNITRAAQKLEVSPSTIYRKKQSWSEMA